MQVLKNPDLDRESSKDDKENKEERDKLSPKDLKNRNKRDDKIREKSSRDRETKPIIKGYRERVDDRNKDREIKQRRYDDKKIYGRRDEREGVREERRIELKDDRRYETRDDRKVEEKRGKSYEKMRQEKKKLAETKKLMVDANACDVSPKKLKEESDIAPEGEDVSGNVKEFSHDEDDTKRIQDVEHASCDTAEDRMMIEDAAPDCLDVAERAGSSMDNAGKIIQSFALEIFFTTEN